MTTLSPVQQKFIVHWGEMGARWGVNRTVAQIHALLYLASEPLHADQIVTLLSVARSNVSNSLRELEDWGLIKASHTLGDRRERYEAIKDVWEMLRIIMDERKRREIDPSVNALRECLKEFDASANGNSYTRERLLELLSLFETVTALYDDLKQTPPGRIRQALKIRGKFRKLLASL